MSAAPRSIGFWRLAVVGFAPDNRRDMKSPLGRNAAQGGNCSCLTRPPWRLPVTCRPTFRNGGCANGRTSPHCAPTYQGVAIWRTTMVDPSDRPTYLDPYSLLSAPTSQQNLPEADIADRLVNQKGNDRCGFSKVDRAALNVALRRGRGSNPQLPRLKSTPAFFRADQPSSGPRWSATPSRCRRSSTAR